jgi:hypothetical protein
MCASCFSGHSCFLRPAEPPKRRKRFANRASLSKALWEDPEIRARHRAAMDSPEVRAKLKKAQKARMRRPEERAKLSASMKATWKDLAVRKRRGMAISAAWARRRERLGQERVTVPRSGRARAEGAAHVAGKASVGDQVCA